MMRVFLFLFLLGAPFLVNAQVKITEIMYDLEGADAGREWIEIKNEGLDAVDITTFKFFEADTNHKLILISGDALLLPGAYAIIADNPEKFKTDWPHWSGVLLNSSFSLSNSGESLMLRNSDLQDEDIVSYSSGMGAAGDGHSLQKIGLQWISAFPTPGMPTVEPAHSSKPVSLSKISPDQSFVETAELVTDQKRIYAPEIQNTTLPAVTSSFTAPDIASREHISGDSFYFMIALVSIIILGALSYLFIRKEKTPADAYEIMEDN